MTKVILSIRQIKIYWILFSVILFFSGCSRNNISGKTEIRFAAYADLQSRKTLNKVIKIFEEKNPNIKIRLETLAPDRYYSKILTEAAAGTLPDIFYAQQQKYVMFASKRIIQPLDKFLAKEKTFSINDFYKPLIQSVTFHGKIYLLPKGWHPFVVYYNKDMFDKAGIPYPREDWTWDDFLNIAKSLTKDTNNDGRTDQFGVEVDYWQGPLGVFLMGAGGGIVSQDGRKIIVNSPPSVRAIKFVTDLQKLGVAPTEAESETIGGNRGFMMGKIGMYISGRWFTPGFRHIKTFDWDVAPVPIGPIKRRITPIEFTGVVMNKNTKYPEESWKFISFLVGPEGTRMFAEIGTDVPAIKDKVAMELFLAPDKKPANSRIFIEAAKYARFYPAYGVWYSAVQTSFISALDLIKLGKPVKATLDKFAPKMQKELDDFWKIFNKQS